MMKKQWHKALYVLVLMSTGGTIIAMGSRPLKNQPAPSSVQRTVQPPQRQPVLSQEDQELQRALEESALLAKQHEREQEEYEMAIQKSLSQKEEIADLIDFSDQTEKDPNENDSQNMESVLLELAIKESLNSVQPEAKQPSPSIVLQQPLKPTVKENSAPTRQAPVKPQTIRLQPKPMPAIPSSDVIELKGLAQQQADCGMYASIHCLAMNHLFKNREQFINSAHALATMSYQFKNEWEKARNSIPFAKRKEHEKTGNKPINNLEIDEMQRIIRSMDIAHDEYIVFLTIKDNTIKPAGLSNPFFMSLEQRMNLFKLSSTDLITFVCNTGGHWISIIAYKKENKLSFFYINSASSSFKNDINAQKFVASLRADLKD